MLLMYCDMPQAYCSLCHARRSNVDTIRIYIHPSVTPTFERRAAQSAFFVARETRKQRLLMSPHVVEVEHVSVERVGQSVQNNAASTCSGKLDTHATDAMARMLTKIQTKVSLSD